MRHSTSPVPSISKKSVRVNLILKPDIAEPFFETVPLGKRNVLISTWIKEGVRYLKHQSAVERIRQLREEGAKIPVSDKRNSTEILREFRYAR